LPDKYVMIYATIEFQNKEYPFREVELPEFGHVFVSTVELNDSLIDEKGHYVSEAANHVDEQIYFFADENEIKLSDDDLISRALKSQF